MQPLESHSLDRNSRRRTLLKDVVVILSRFVQRVDDRLSLAEIIAFQPFPEIENGYLVVERRHEIPFRRSGNGKQIIALAVFAHVLCLSRKNVLVESRVRDEKGLLAREVNVSPVGRGDIVCIGHDQIAQSRHERSLVPFQRKHTAHRFCALSVITVLLVESDRHREIVGNFAFEFRLVLRITNRTGQTFAIVRRKGRNKIHFQRESVARKRIMCSECGNGYTRLFQLTRTVPSAQKAIRIAVGMHKTVCTAGKPRPEHCIAAIEFVARRPHRKVRIDYPPRIRR